MFLFAQKLWLRQALGAAYCREPRAVPRPAKADAERKSTRLAIRLTPAERLQIEQAAHKAGVSTSSYLRAQALHGQIVIQQPRGLDHATFDQIRRIGVNLNQLARIANQTGEIPEDLPRALALLEQLLQREFAPQPTIAFPHGIPELPDDT